MWRKEVYRLDFVLLCTKKFLQPHCWVLDPTQRQRDNGKQWKVLDWPSQSSDLNPVEHAFHLLKRRLKTWRSQSNSKA
uniref:Tc1-like transposase DDE domain-containing protein n=1 Tax=Anguilla anguilla TaxID=7936 RepID=A0A0E9RZK0_ANGAN